jgi:hypothetical protein
VIPGYVFFSVIYTMRPELLVMGGSSIDVGLLTLLGVPVGWIIQSIHRAFFYLLGCENRLNIRDTIYIVGHNNITRKDEKNREAFRKKDFFYYAASIDYLLLSSKKYNCFYKHIRFLYTRVHSSSSVMISIILAIIFIFLNPCSFSTVSSSFVKKCILSFWFCTVILLLYLSIATAGRILWWRRLVVKNNYNDFKRQIENNV